jgi:hypothetical protein
VDKAAPSRAEGRAPETPSVVLGVVAAIVVAAIVLISLIALLVAWLP